ncbi:MAG: LPS export ABC transporter permease LptG [Pseudomonadota bacterium]
MTRYDRQLARAFAMGMVPVAVLLLALFGFLVLAETLEDVGQGRFGTSDAVLVTALRLPRILTDLWPVIVLLGGLLGLGTLASGSELIALRAAGIAPLRQARPVLLVLLLLIIADAWLALRVIPVAEVSANRISARALTTAQPDSTLGSDSELGLDGLGNLEDSDGAFWTRDARGYLRVNQLSRGRTPIDVEIYTRSATGEPTQLIRAARASEVGSDSWLLEDVWLWDLTTDQPAPQRLARWRWSSFVPEAELARLIVPAAALAPPDLYSYIADLTRRGLESQRYEVALWQTLTRPLSLLAMALLAVAMVQGSLRRIPLGTRVAAGAMLGIGNYLLEQSGSQLAVLLDGNAAVVALAPRLALLLLAITLLLRRAP